MTLSQLVQFHRPYMSRVDEPAEAAGLIEAAGPAANPGALRMLTYVPHGLPYGAPLLVVLHGCTQGAAGYDHGAGWSTLADRHGFALLFPEQSRDNNSHRCFNWFQAADTARNGGEAHSIRQMIAAMVAAHNLNAERVFITGLSAGGAMAAAMLAAYPEVFAGGAIIAGVPVGAAASMHGAFEAMFQGRSRPAVEWGDRVRAASGHRGRWPRIQIWHGDADATVRPSNAGESLKQWMDVHGVMAAPSFAGWVDGATYQAWCNEEGDIVVEAFTVPRLTHGAPLDTRSGDRDRATGAAGPYMLEAGISSTWHIAYAFGLLSSIRR